MHLGLVFFFFNFPEASALSESKEMVTFLDLTQTNCASKLFVPENCRVPKNSLAEASGVEFLVRYNRGCGVQR